jgi:hypothetical protein
VLEEKLKKMQISHPIQQQHIIALLASLNEGDPSSSSSSLVYNAAVPVPQSSSSSTLLSTEKTAQTRKGIEKQISMLAERNQGSVEEVIKECTLSLEKLKVNHTSCRESIQNAFSSLRDTLATIQSRNF